MLERFIWKLRGGRVPTILHIGPNSLARREIDDYMLLLHLAQGACRFIFVEPLARQLAHLKRRLYAAVERSGLGFNHTLTFVHAAVCPPAAAAEETTLHTLSRALLADFPQAPWLVDGFGDLSSLSWAQFYRGIQRFAWKRHYPQMSEEEWAASPYVRRIPVRCVTPSALLAEVGLEPGDVDLFISDTEGFDSQLVPAFFDLGQFSPAVLHFEYVNQRLDANTTFAVVGQLAAQYYEVHAHSIDVVALGADQKQDVSAIGPEERGLLRYIASERIYLHHLASGDALAHDMH